MANAYVIVGGSLAGATAAATLREEGADGTVTLIGAERELPYERPALSKAFIARDYGKGIQYGRQHFYASFDLALHGADAPEPMALWARMEGATPLGHVAGTKGPAAFGHVAGGYAAGYYGYLWSLVVALDLRTAFNGDRLDPVVGARYRQTVLAQGSQRPPKELVREFLGRETNSKAFFEWLKR